MIAKLKNIPEVILPFSNLVEGYVCVQFKGHSVSAIYLKLKEHFEEHNIPFKTDFTDFELFKDSIYIDDAALMKLANPEEEDGELLTKSQISKPSMKSKIEDEIPLNFQKIFQLLRERSEKKMSLGMFKKAIKNIRILRSKELPTSDKL